MEIVVGILALLVGGLAGSVILWAFLVEAVKLVPKSRREKWAVYAAKWHRPNDLVQIEESISLAEYHGDEPGLPPTRQPELTKPPKVQ